jgi:hypothetical protein
VDIYGGGGRTAYSKGGWQRAPMAPIVQIRAQFVTVLLGDAALDEEDMEWSHVLLRGRAFQIGLIPVSLVAVIPCQ